MLSLTPSVRKALKTPLGTLHESVEEALRDASDDHTVVTVGDIVTAGSMKAGMRPAVSVVDYETKRTSIQQRVMETLPEPTHKASNPAGTLSDELAKTLRAVVNDAAESTVLVDGEEDLAVLPLLLLLEDGDRILYGQPDQGVVAVTVSPETRGAARSYLNQMDGPTDTYLKHLGC